MKTIDLKGAWEFRERGTEGWLGATVPGCNFTDLVKAGKIKEPFSCDDAKNIYEKDWEHRKTFEVTEEFLECAHVELEIDGLDTVADVFVNGTKVLSAENAFIKHVANVRGVLVLGKNEILITLYSPVKACAERALAYEFKLPTSKESAGAFQFLRKPAYSFGWDFAPSLPSSGIVGDIRLCGYKARLGLVKINQKHSAEGVTVSASAEVVGGEWEPIYTLYAPNGERIASVSEGHFSYLVKHPELWNANDGTKAEQPLYTLKVELTHGETKTFKLGLRTIEQDLGKTDWGERFAFCVNGRRLFARGANFVPADVFLHRVDRAKTDFLVKSMRDAGFNMVRVWGGGRYETEEFYDACDRYGILVWQEFPFACKIYPLTDARFLANVAEEVRQNVGRLHYRASLAMWCGENELEQMKGEWRIDKRLTEAHGRFFYETLPSLIRGVVGADGNTPYWAGSASSGKFLYKANWGRVGDTHLWHVWFALKPYQYYKKVRANFVSEFGLQSAPNGNALANLKDENNLLLQKYYLLQDFCEPKSAEDFAILTQVVQAKAVKTAVEAWRRDLARCFGALYWQYNDCAERCSWSGVGYDGRFKAMQYFAKHFFAPIMLSVDERVRGGGGRGRIFVHNETATDFSGKVAWSLVSFDGGTIKGKTKAVNVKAGTAVQVAQGRLRKGAVLVAELTAEDGRVVSRKTALCGKERDITLHKCEIKSSVTVSSNTATITLKASSFARFVYLDLSADGAEGFWVAQFSDNFFDMLAGESKVVTVAVPEGWTAEAVGEKLRVKSLCDIELAGTKKDAKRFVRKVKRNPRFFARRLIRLVSPRYKW